MASNRSCLWLAAGAALLLVANGRWIVPLAAWLAPLFLFRFSRKLKPLPCLGLTLLAYIVVHAIAWQSLIPPD